MKCPRCGAVLDQCENGYLECRPERCGLLWWRVKGGRLRGPKKSDRFSAADERWIRAQARKEARLEREADLLRRVGAIP